METMGYKIKKKENETIIELIIEVLDEDKDEEINILCDTNKLIESNRTNKYYYKEKNIDPPIIFDYFNKNNTKLYLNDKEISFNYKIKIKKIGINKIKIISNLNLFSLS